MSGLQVLLVAGTHGNEVNAPWLFDQWFKRPDLIKTNGLKLRKVIGNPLARKACLRYLDRDLNRSFDPEILNSQSNKDYEVKRANDLLDLYGPTGQNPCQIAIDFHSTTAAMGCCLVVYGRRYADFALAALIQHRLGLPIYLHEGDNSQKGFLVESWPCGLVIEVGPAPQGLLSNQIIHQTRLSLEICIEEIAKINSGLAYYPNHLVVHRHLGSKDYPRDSSQNMLGIIHTDFEKQNWIPLSQGAPLFISLDGTNILYNGANNDIPVFINEASYVEKNIAFSLTKKEVLPFDNDWSNAINSLILMT